MAVVVTANFGDHDYPPRVPCPQDVPTEWLYFTDGDELAPEPWRTIRASRSFESSNLCAKVYKTCPPVDTPDTIWIDGNMEITAARFVREALAARRDGIAVWSHPRRDCIYTEAEACVGAESQGGKYDGWDIAGQVASYRSEGHPAHAGLYACGTVAWDLDNERARRAGAMWLAECVRWSPQDQLSFPVVCRRLGIHPGVFPYRQTPHGFNRKQRCFINRWLKIHPHRHMVTT